MNGGWHAKKHLLKQLVLIYFAQIWLFKTTTATLYDVGRLVLFPIVTQPTAQQQHRVWVVGWWWWVVVVVGGGGGWWLVVDLLIMWSLPTCVEVELGL